MQALQIQGFLFNLYQAKPSTLIYGPAYVDEGTSQNNYKRTTVLVLPSVRSCRLQSLNPFRNLYSKPCDDPCYANSYMQTTLVAPLIEPSSPDRCT